MTLRVVVVTVARSDYGVYFPLLRLLREDVQIDLKLIVAAAHLNPKYGNTIREIENDGFPIAARVPMAMRGDSREDVAAVMGDGIREFAIAYKEIQPAILLLLGDRYEMFSAAIAGLALKIPIAHIHGGELTLGAMDDAIRHSMTKLSHLHFAATAEYAQRIKQLGEEPWRIHLTGSPVIDSIFSVEPIPRATLESEIGLDLPRTLLVTYHPVTLENQQAECISNLLTALEESGLSLLFTHPNADPDNAQIIQHITEFAAHHTNVRLVSNLGHRKYHSLQRYVAAMVGNSSSGIIEAATFRLPVVNIGKRQEGRIHGANVIDVADSTEAIRKGIELATSSDFRRSIENVRNPYGEGGAAEKIVDALKSVELGPKLLLKRFVDYNLD